MQLRLSQYELDNFQIWECTFFPWINLPGEIIAKNFWSLRKLYNQKYQDRRADSDMNRAQRLIPRTYIGDKVIATDSPQQENIFQCSFKFVFSWDAINKANQFPRADRVWRAVWSQPPVRILCVQTSWALCSIVYGKLRQDQILILA